MKTVALFLTLLTVPLVAQNRSPIDLANVKPPADIQRIAYGKDPQQFGELRVPKGPGPHPLAIVVHGGCWLEKLGNYPLGAVALDNMRPMAMALNDAGIATWNIEYRRLGNPGGGWPGTYLDVANAADFVRTIAKAHQLDLTRTIAIGHSAGGHLVMWLAARPKIQKGSDLFIGDPLRLRGVVNLDGPADLQATIPLQQPICGSPVITDLMGGSQAQQPARYKAGSPIEMLPFDGEQVVLAGQMFGAQVPDYQAAAKRTGNSVKATVLPDAGHFLFIDPLSTVWPQVLAAVRTIVER